ncbi:CopG family ribbon-helix-helix protein [Halalkalicoccus tibetensis]|uniref:CopG family ribbon-helix-helix protein n=1 Tax=Halalkalicoccus tibetensis TaxID=175632 RepID=A0ABD5V094_9EURY
MRTSLNVPEEVLEEFDRTWQAEGLGSRSRAIREAMAEYVESHTELEGMEGTVAAAVVFDYEHTAVIEALHDVQHEYQDVIGSTSHTHQGDWCLETLFCRGDVADVRELVYRLKDFDHVRRVNVMLIEVDEE